MPTQLEVWMYRPSLSVPDDLDGFDIEARDGSIGDVDGATNDVSGSYIVVKTGPWIFGKKVILPAGTIDKIDLENRKVFVGLTKEQIKSAPEYDPDRFDEDYRDRLGSYYSRV